MQYRYTGGVQEVSVVFPDRVLDVHTGDVVELTDAEVDALGAAHPDWQPAEPAAPIAGLKRAELVELADEAGVDSTGTRSDLIARLTAATPTTPSNTDPASQEG
jgi:hypothetical protein